MCTLLPLRSHTDVCLVYDVSIRPSVSSLAIIIPLIGGPKFMILLMVNCPLNELHNRFVVLACRCVPLIAYVAPESDSPALVRLTTKY